LKKSKDNELYYWVSTHLIILLLFNWNVALSCHFLANALSLALSLSSKAVLCLACR